MTTSTKLLVKPRLKATYRPQAWINDYAVDIDDGRQGLDATEALLRCFTAEQIRDFHFHDSDTDALARFTGVGDDPDGPFEVDVDENEFGRFWKANGVKDWSEITEEKLAAIRARYGYSAHGSLSGLGPKVHEWLATLPGRHVLFERCPTSFLGRNGTFGAVGLYVSKLGSPPTVHLEPITKKGIGRTRLEIPLSCVPALSAILQDILPRQERALTALTKAVPKKERGR